jgi:EmrB/QacA subfamily drug resistance transporter
MSTIKLSRRELLITFSGLLLVMLLGALDSTIVATALPTIVGELGGLERLAWVVTAYLLAQTVVTPIYGKLGDLYGRKIVLQVGIVIFLVGSALCGLSQSMLALILFRALQGIGGGGLIVTTQAVVGDIVSPRERGRYQGIFGAVFGVSSIAGPLLGGYFTTNLSWRWIFYINLPLGLLAFGVIAATLPSLEERVRHEIDYLGAALLAIALSALVILTDLGGVTYPWDSAQIIVLAVIAIAGLIGFVLAERRAAEPVLPLRLFENRTFTVTAAIALIVGFALFGSVTYLPLFLQVVSGASPTGSGLQMLPMMGGMLLTSIASGQLISRWGRYKPFPIVGTAVMAVGLFLLSTMSPETTVTGASINMLVLGLGLGMVMQVLVIVVQNAVDYSDLGVATSGATLFRLIGGSLGTAIFGAIFASRLGSYLSRALPAGAPTPAAGAGLSPQFVTELPPAFRAIYLGGFTSSLSAVFLTATAIALCGFVLTWLVPERPLRETVATAAGDVGLEAEEVFPMPTDSDSLSKLERVLSLQASREAKRRYVANVVERAGVELTPLAAWLLVRLEEETSLGLDALARRYEIEPAQLETAHDELLDRGVIEEERPAGRAPRRAITAQGLQVLERLGEARRARLAELIAEWRPEDRDALVERLGWAARAEIGDESPPAGGSHNADRPPPVDADQPPPAAGRRPGAHG